MATKHWTQTPAGKRKMRLLRKERALKREGVEPEGEEDKLHLLYMLPGLEMAAHQTVERINSIRKILGQGPWHFGSAGAAMESNSHPPVRKAPPVRKKKKHRISPEGMKRLKEAQAKRWEAFHADKEAKPGKRKLSEKQLRAMKKNAAKARAALRAKQAQ
jgi:hypothetical protein